MHYFYVTFAIVMGILSPTFIWMLCAVLYFGVSNWVAETKVTRRNSLIEEARFKVTYIEPWPNRKGFYIKGCASNARGVFYVTMSCECDMLEMGMKYE